MQGTIFDDLSCAQVDCILMAKITDTVILASGKNPPESMCWAIQMMTEYVNIRADLDDDYQCSEEYASAIQDAALEIIHDMPKTPDIARAVAAAIHADISALPATVRWMPADHSAKSWAAMLAEIGGLLDTYARTGAENHGFATLVRAIPSMHYPN